MQLLTHLVMPICYLHTVCLELLERDSFIKFRPWNLTDNPLLYDLILPIHQQGTQYTMIPQTVCHECPM